MESSRGLRRGCLVASRALHRAEGPSTTQRFCSVLIAAALVASSAGIAPAAEEFAKVGTIGAQFLKLPIGARATSMGQAFTAIADDATAVFWNPAGLARNEGSILSLNHTQWWAGIEYVQATYVTRTNLMPGTFAVNARSMYMPRERVRTVFHPEGDGTWFDAGDLAVGLAYARSMTDKFSAGIGMSYLNSNLAGYTAHAVAFDFGTLYDTGFRSFRIGMAIQNIGSTLDYMDSPAKLPTIFRVGMSFPVINSDVTTLTLATEFSHPPDNHERLNAGAEYGYRSLVFLRAGWFYRFDSELWSAGAGLRVPTGWIRESRIDYSYSEMRTLPSVHRFSLEFRF